ncbi:GNAT family N-acetyltransferase [Colwellia sp. MEBiC06753]
MKNVSPSLWRQMLSTKLAYKQHRTAIFLQGDFAWAQVFVESADIKPVMMFSDDESAENTVSSKTYRHHLGTENQAIFFADGNFNVDAFAALSGTLVAGGRFYIWLPTNISEQNSPYLKRLLTIASEKPDIYWLEQDKSLPKIDLDFANDNGLSTNVLPTVAKLSIPKPLITQPSITKGQLSAIKHIVNVVTGKRNKPFVLTADRGRGKSTALALAVAELFRESTRALKIVITAPHQMALSVFYQHLRHQLPEASFTHLSVHFREHQLQFLPIDELINLRPTLDLLLIDEAAGVPVYLLTELMKHHHRMVFSSTIHGYEGAGRGFTGKFLPLLKLYAHTVNTWQLTEPVRWANGDPLETLIFETCLLNAELPESPIQEGDTPDVNQLTYQYFQGKELLENEVLLRQIFAILVTAHYQTKPSDLKMMLDDPLISVMVLSQNVRDNTTQNKAQIPLAVALIIAEGNVDTELASQIVAGKRRIKGQLIPQALTQQLLVDNAFNFNYLRVMRIAVHPELQGQGLGSMLLSAVEQYGEAQHIDFIGTSFAANEQVVKFWHKSGHVPVKLGFNRDASSGEHSLIMLKPLTRQASDLSHSLSAEFHHNFRLWLTDEFKHLPLNLIRLLLSLADVKDIPELTARDLAKLAAFKHNVHLFSVAREAISTWLLRQCTDQSYTVVTTHANKNLDKPSGDKLSPLIAKCLLLKSDSEICQQFGFTGKKALYQYFQQLLIS